jgi:hypothetical protein
MKMKIFSIRDRKVDAFMAPLGMQTAGQACRMLQDEMSRERTGVLGAHPEDFELFLVGEFETETGKLEGRQAPQSVMQLSELVTKE